MQELITIESKPALLSVNFDELKTHLGKELEQYDVVVTVDTVADAKKLCAELNATKKEISDKRKATIAEASAPVKKFEEQMKELEQMCTDGRAKLTSQIAKFEDETRKKVQALLVEHCAAEYIKQDVTAEFQDVIVDDLVALSAITKTGNLTGKTKSAVQERVMNARKWQDQTEKRLLLLENQSYKAGLAAPLTRGHVETFLFETDDVYEQRLSALFESELKREEIAKETMRKKMEAENSTPTPAPSEPQTEPMHYRPEPSEVAAPEHNPEDYEPGESVEVLVNCCFKTVVPVEVSDERIQQAVAEKLAEAGITTLEAVTVTRKKLAA